MHWIDVFSCEIFYTSECLFRYFNFFTKGNRTFLMLLINKQKWINSEVDYLIVGSRLEACIAMLGASHNLTGTFHLNYQND